MSIWCQTRKVFISTVATGTDSIMITGSGPPSTVDPGALLACLLSQRLLWLYPLIIFSVYRQNIIGYIMETSIGIGGIGAIITTGTTRLGSEIIPTIIGVAEIFIGHQEVIMLEEVTLAEGDISHR